MKNPQYLTARVVLYTIALVLFVLTGFVIGHYDVRELPYALVSFTSFLWGALLYDFWRENW